MSNNSDRIILFDEDAQKKVAQGVNLLADAVKITMGPRGRNVVIERVNNFPHVTKDGVTVAKAINVKEKFINLGIQMIKEAALRSGEFAGDGTTTATVLSQSIYNSGLRMIASGFVASDLLEGIARGTEVVLEELQALSKPVSRDEDIVQIGTISSNGDITIGNLLLQAMHAVGKDGVITVEDAKGSRTTLDVVEGCEISRGFLSPYFITHHEKNAAILQNPRVLLVNKSLSSLQDILPLLEKVHNERKPVLVIADDIEGDALQGLVVNKLKGTLDICAIRAPEFGQGRVNLFDDLAVLLKTRVFTEVDIDDLRAVRLDDLGSCKKIVVTRGKTLLVGCAGEKHLIEERINDIKRNMQDPSFDTDEIQHANRRLATLANGVAVLRIGATTEIELLETKDRVDDALNATQAAVMEGIVPGGGVALVKAAKSLDRLVKEHSGVSFGAGLAIVREACDAPFKQIIQNTGQHSEMPLQKVKKAKDDLGYDAKNDRFVKMYEEGIIDPLRVVRYAMENASSTARMLLSIGCTIVNDMPLDSE